MATIIVPTAGTEINVTQFGKPVADQVNANTVALNQMQTVDLAHLPGRRWFNSLGAANGGSGFVTIPGSTTIPTETGARKWIIDASLHVDGAEPSTPKVAYAYL